MQHVYQDWNTPANLRNIAFIFFLLLLFFFKSWSTYPQGSESLSRWMSMPPTSTQWWLPLRVAGRRTNACSGCVPNYQFDASHRVIGNACCCIDSMHYRLRDVCMPDVMSKQVIGHVWCVIFAMTIFLSLWHTVSAIWQCYGNNE